MHEFVASADDFNIYDGEKLKPYIDNCMRIPMTDKVRALNVSNSVAIMLYEALRQQDYLDLLREEPHKSKNFIEEEG